MGKYIDGIGHDTVFLKGKAFDVRFVVEDERVVILAVEKFGEDFKDVLSNAAILSVRALLEPGFRKERSTC